FAISSVVILSACRPAPAPTMSASDVEGTAIANAWAAVTQTQAAMPTFTPTALPPTPTLLPTIIPFPTIPPLQATVPANNSSVTDPCNDIPPADPKGTTVQVEFINKSDGRVAPLSFGMIKQNSLGECGTYTFYLGYRESNTQTVLAGCYWAYGYVDTPSSAKNIEYLCVTDTTKTVAIWVTNEVIGFH
ncbi:MAG: hypothetical protein PHQ36_11300, partial [Anaerolineales bacterium]|nr:hypothetical protein [Anaerolineales bacterium]